MKKTGQAGRALQTAKKFARRLWAEFIKQRPMMFGETSSWAEYCCAWGAAIGLLFLAAWADSIDKL